MLQPCSQGFSPLPQAVSSSCFLLCSFSPGVLAKMVAAERNSNWYFLGLLWSWEDCQERQEIWVIAEPVSEPLVPGLCNDVCMGEGAVWSRWKTLVTET